MTFAIDNGTVFNSSDRYQLVKPGVVDYNFELPVIEGDEDEFLSTITFNIGVDADTNAETEMDFTERATDDPLGQQDPTMHWGWTGGYRFMNIDGVADLNGDGQFNTPLTYHLGKNSFLKSISLSVNEKLESGQNDMRILFDVGAFLNGLDFATENFTKVQPDNMDVADKLLANYNNAVSFTK